MACSVALSPSFYLSLSLSLSLRRQWGQFIDHDISLISEDHSTWDHSSNMAIYIPCGDPVFDPDSECNAEHVMDAFRSSAHNDSGTGPEDIRYQPNTITSWIDASMVYGSDQDTADSLRFLLLLRMHDSSKLYLYFNVFCSGRLTPD